MRSFQESIGIGIAEAAKTAIRWISPTIDNFDTRISMGAGGVLHRDSAGRVKEIGGTNNGNSALVIWGGTNSKRVSAEKAMARNTGWVYAMVGAIADEIANTEWRMFQVQTSGDHEEQFDHPLLDLLNGVNDNQTGVEFKHLMASHLEITGNAYILKMDASGKPVASVSAVPESLALLHPAKVIIELDKTNYPYKIARYKFRFDGNEWTYQPYQIVQIKYPDPDDQHSGIGTVQAIPEWLDLDQYISDWNIGFFRNGAKPSGQLSGPYKTEAQVNRLRASFDQNYTGVGNSSKVTYLPDGVKFTGDASVKDMDFGTLIDKTQDRISAGFRVSRTILGTAEADTNRATAETADYVFAKRTIKPKMMIITACLNEFLVPLFGDDIYLSFEDPVPEDKAFRTQEMQAATGNQPVLSVNEARENFMGLGPVEGGDEVMVSTTFQAIGAPKERTGGSSTSGTPKDGKSISRAPGMTAKFFRKNGKIKTRYARNREVRHELAEKMGAALAAAVKEIRGKNVWELSHQEYYSIWKDFTGRVEKFESQMREKVLEMNKEQMKEVLANLPDATGVTKAVNPADLFSVDKWISIMVDFTTPIMQQLGKEEATYAAGVVNVPEAASVFDTPEHQAALTNAIQLMSKSYNQTTLSALQTKLDEGISQGMSLSDLTASVKDVYAWSDSRRAGLVAKTESFRIANDTTKATWKASGVVSTIKWYTAEDQTVCEFCAEQDGKTISIDDDFFTKGDVATGADGGSLNLDYSDVGAPPLHPDCRCYVRPEDVSI